MNTHVHGDVNLTKNQSLVFGALSKSNAPLTAYTILDQLRDNGFRAPLQVYRALEKLVEFGIVHRLESLNAFVACSHPDCGNSKVIAFTICETCSNVSEISDNSLAGQLQSIANNAQFTLTKSTVELQGTCNRCQNI